MNKSIDDHSKCQVCFVRPLDSLQFHTIIKCKICHKICHKGCYQPELQGNVFECDQCMNNPKKSQKCYLCGNKGLLKKVQDFYAHPICLLFNDNILTVQFKTLKFQVIDRYQFNLKSKQVCILCKKPNNLQKCFAECSNLVHLYCVWRSYQNSEQQGWNHNAVVGGELDYGFFFENKVRKYLQTINSSFIQNLGSFAKSKYIQSRPPYELACTDHLNNIFECCTNTKYFIQSNINNKIQPVEYIQCDQCFRWYHLECLQKNSLPKSKNSSFKCDCCKKFEKLVNSDVENQFYLSRFPRLNICELIFVHYRYEEKKYKLSQNQLTFMMKLPIYPSLIFVQTRLKSQLEKNLKKNVFFSDIFSLKLKQKKELKIFMKSFNEKYKSIIQIFLNKTKLIEIQSIKKKQQNQDYILANLQDQIVVAITLLKDFNEKIQAPNRNIDKLIKSLQKLNTLNQNDTNSSMEKQSQSSNFYQQKSSNLTKKNLQGSRVSQSYVRHASKNNNQNFQTKIIAKKNTKKQLKSKHLYLPAQERSSKSYFSQSQQKKRSLRSSRISQSQTSSKKFQNEISSSVQKDKELYTSRVLRSSRIVQEKEQMINKQLYKSCVVDKNRKQVLSTSKITKKVQKVQKQKLSNQITSIKYKKQENQNKVENQQKVDGEQQEKLNQLKHIIQNFMNITQNSKKGNMQKQFYQISKKLGDSKQLIIKPFYEKNLKQDQVLRCLQIQALIKFSNGKLEQIKNGIVHIKKQNTSNETNKINSNKQYLEELFDLVIKFYSQCSQKIRKIYKRQITQFQIEFPSKINDVCSQDKTRKVKPKQSMHDIIQVVKKMSATVQNIQMVENYLKTVQNKQQAAAIQIRLTEKKIHLRLRQKQLTRLNWNQLQRSFKQLCESSSSLISEQISDINCRKQILSIQKQLTQHWLNIFSHLFSLAHNVFQNNNDNITHSHQTQQNNEPLQILKNLTIIDQIIFKPILQFFSKIKSQLPYFKIFHIELSKTVEKLAVKFIESLGKYKSIWTEDEVKFSTVKFIFRTYYEKVKVSDRYNKKEMDEIILIFQIEQQCSQKLRLMNINMFDDPMKFQQFLKNQVQKYLTYFKKNQMQSYYQKMSTIKAWMSIFLNVLTRLGPQKFIKGSKADLSMFDKSNRKRFSHQQLYFCVASMQKVKFPLTDFKSQMINFYRSSSKFDNSIQQYFNHRSQCQKLCLKLKQQCQSLDNQPIPFNQQLYNHKLYFPLNQINSFINSLKQNQLKDIVSYELECYEIQMNKEEFLQMVKKAENIIQGKIYQEKIEDINKLMLDMLKMPFYYKNLHVLYKICSDLVDKKNKQSDLKSDSMFYSSKQKIIEEKDQVLIKAAKLLQELLEKIQLSISSKKKCLSINDIKDQVGSIILDLDEKSNRKVSQLYQKIQRYLVDFQKITEKMSPLIKIFQSSKDAKILTENQIQQLDQIRIVYDQQPIYEFSLNRIFIQLTNYHAILMKIPYNQSAINSILFSIQLLPMCLQNNNVQKRKIQLINALNCLENDNQDRNQSQSINRDI